MRPKSLVATFQVISLSDKSSWGPQRNMIIWLGSSLSQPSNLLLITAKLTNSDYISSGLFPHHD